MLPSVFPAAAIGLSRLKLPPFDSLQPNPIVKPEVYL